MLKTKLSAICGVIALSLPAQTVQNFLGKYEIQADCIVEGFDDYSEFHSYEIEIEEHHDVNSNIRFFLHQHGMNDYVRAMVLNDNDFDILSQQFPGSEPSELRFNGEGNIQADSIFMQYSIAAENVFGVLVCDCKGRKLNSSGTASRSESGRNKIYFDITKQAVVIDETLQNPSSSVELLDLHGKTILKKPNVCKFIHIENFPSGIYLCRILQNGRIVYSDKILKM